jgi:phosphotransacetylase
MVISGAPVRLAADEIAVHSVQELAGSAAGQCIVELGRKHGWSDDVIKGRQHDPAFLAAACVSAGMASAAVAGATQPTGDVLRAALQVIGLAPASRLLSSSFLLLPREGPPLAFGDCAVVPEPDEDQLADIAVATADTYASLTGRTPHVAMLSFSTHGSAEHESVRRVRSATDLVRERRPDLNVDGELQLDAALVESVALAKAQGSTVAGHANVLIFPNLAAGNIGYKIAQRLGGAEAFGPIIQGLAAPMNDLSRGCSTDDVVSVAVLSALQARSQALAHPQHAD